DYQLLRRFCRSRGGGWRREVPFHCPAWTLLADTVLICRSPAGAFFAANLGARAAAGGCSSCGSNRFVPKRMLRLSTLQPLTIRGAFGFPWDPCSAPYMSADGCLYGSGRQRSYKRSVAGVAVMRFSPLVHGISGYRATMTGGAWPIDGLAGSGSEATSRSQRERTS